MEGWEQRSEKREDAVLLALKLEEGAVNQGTQTTSRNWKRQRND